jgi:TonB family protein
MRFCASPISTTNGELSRFSGNFNALPASARKGKNFTRPTPLAPIAPSFPPNLMDAGVGGAVEVVVGVSASGEVEDALVVCADNPQLAAAALASIRATSFHPATLDGKPVRQLVRIPFRFEP